MLNKEYVVTLKNEKSLNILEQGIKTGTPAIYLHGAPGSKRDHTSHKDFYARHNIRMISVNRPGTGLSTYYQDWSALTFAVDLRDLMNSLAIDNATIIGFSAGGLYACAFAHQFPERTKKLLLLSSVAPFDNSSLYGQLTETAQVFYEQSKNNPDLLLEQLSGVTTPEALLDIMKSLASDPDQQLFNAPDIRKDILYSFSDVLEQGLASFIKEVYNIAIPWGFSPCEISVATEIWHGTEDSNIPIACSQYLAENISHSETKYKENSGHYFSFAMWQEILKSTLSTEII